MRLFYFFFLCICATFGHAETIVEKASRTFSQCRALVDSIQGKEKFIVPKERTSYRTHMQKIQKFLEDRQTNLESKIGSPAHSEPHIKEELNGLMTRCQALVSALKNTYSPITSALQKCRALMNPLEGQKRTLQKRHHKSYDLKTASFKKFVTAKEALFHTKTESSFGKESPLLTQELNAFHAECLKQTASLKKDLTRYRNPRATRTLRTKNPRKITRSSHKNKALT